MNSHGDMGAARPSQPAWQQSLAELALACAGSAPGDEPARLCELRVIVRSRPHELMRAGLTLPAQSAFEALLAADASESAALAFFGAGAGYILSRGAGGQHLVSVVLDGSDAEVSAGGESLALALTGALALALSEARAPAMPPRSSQIAGSMRFN